jgi:3-oxoadipate enol-lactonase
MPFLKRPDEPDLYYEIDDYTDPWRNAPYLILQHGYGRSGRFWYSWVPYLARFYKVVRPDIRGLGRSAAQFDLEHAFTYENCIADLAALVGHLGAGSVHYCGESQGGILGLGFAATHPGLVRTLTLVSTPVRLGTKSYGHGYATEAEAQQAMGMKGWVAATNVGMRFPLETDPGLLKWYEDEFATNRADVQLAMSKVFHAVDASVYLPKNQAPVLGLYPSAGPITNPEQERLLTSNIANLRMVHLPATFHKVQLIFPAACANHLLHFAAQCDGISCREP